jgi:hypothetical protein
MTDDTTLAEWVSHGWKLGLFCGACRAPVAALTSTDIMARFGDSLLATIGEVCARMKCPACGHRGGWHTGVNDITPEVAVNVAGEPPGGWVARDLYLRSLLAVHGRSLAIADAVWAKIGAFGSEHPDWEARRSAAPAYPLSAQGAAALVGSKVPLGKLAGETLNQ